MNEHTANNGGRASGEAGAAARNADLWTTYLRRQARQWVDPLGLANPRAVDVLARPLADMAAIAISGWFSVFAARPTAALYRSNAGDVNRFVAEQAIDPDAIEIPAQFTVVSGHPRPPFAPTQTEAWPVVEPAREPALVR